MDIDDILAEVSRDSPAQQHEQAARDLEELTRLWVAERVAPEILPYPDALMERVLDRVRKQMFSETPFVEESERGREGPC
ncbi:putative dna replication complex gins protein sld5 protein [Lasiodiplodia theobromae]|nr:putative dna replication complex gins protein sld5 protein [Lasiodiplodia theobromae]